MPGVTMYIPVQLRTLHLWYDRTRTIGAPQHDMKHTMDTSCGTPWNTSTMDVPWERSIHISRAVPPRSQDTAPVSSLPRSHYFFFRFSSMFFLFSRYFSFRILSCYQVQGQPIEGNFLVSIASACPPRTILRAPFFILAHYSFSCYTFSFPPHLSLISRSHFTNSRMTRKLEGKHRWKLVRDAFSHRRTG